MIRCVGDSENFVTADICHIRNSAHIPVSENPYGVFGLSIYLFITFIPYNYNSFFVGFQGGMNKDDIKILWLYYVYFVMNVKI